VAVYPLGVSRISFCLCPRVVRVGLMAARVRPPGRYRTRLGQFAPRNNADDWSIYLGKGEWQPLDDGPDVGRS